MAFVFKIKIEGSQKPPIWRKVKVNESISFDDLHLVIQVLFSWDNSHMYQFSPKDYGSTPRIMYVYEDDAEVEVRPLSPPDSFPYSERYDATIIKINEYFKIPKQKMIYIYDFGDDWKHTVELVEITDEVVLYPMCLAGKGSDMIEDCGGIWGFYNLVEIINDPKHPEHKEYREWLGMEDDEKWDLNAFDLEGTNRILEEVWKIKRKEKI